jgi:hypothetical protein
VGLVCRKMRVHDDTISVGWAAGDGYRGG